MIKNILHEKKIENIDHHKKQQKKIHKTLSLNET